jgi:hypothetical protein
MNWFALLLAVSVIAMSGCGGANVQQDVNQPRQLRGVAAERSSSSADELSESRRLSRPLHSGSDPDADAPDRPSRDDRRASSPANAVGEDRAKAGTAGTNAAIKKPNSTPGQAAEASGNAATDR